MLRRSDIQPGPLAILAVVTAILVLVVPTCAMVGCTMTGSAMFVPFGSNPTMSAPCGGTYVVSKSPVSTVPTEAPATLLVAVAALVMAATLALPRVEAAPVRSARDGPPPPDEPLDDVRLRI